MFKKLSVVASLFFVACGGADVRGACEAYIEANNGCVAEAYGDATVPTGAELDAETICAPYDELSGADAKAQADQLNCYADGIAAVDCSDPATYATAITDALAACPLE